MHRRSVFCERILISPWSMYIIILIILSVLQLCIFIQVLSFFLFEKHTVIYVAGSQLYSNNTCISLKGVVQFTCFIFLRHSEVVFTFPRLESMGIAQFPNFPLEEYMLSRKIIATYICCVPVCVCVCMKELHTDFHRRMFCDVNVILHYRQRPPSEEQVFIYMYF